MLLGKIFERFVKDSTITVMVRLLLEKALNLAQLDAMFEGVAIAPHPVLGDDQSKTQTLVAHRYQGVTPPDLTFRGYFQPEPQQCLLHP